MTVAKEEFYTTVQSENTVMVMEIGMDTNSVQAQNNTNVLIQSDNGQASGSASTSVSHSNFFNQHNFTTSNASNEDIIEYGRLIVLG